MKTKGRNARKGGSILTHSGKLFWPMDARPEEVDIQDIAHALSNMCRFAGHINHFYSVAQHCVMVSELVVPSNADGNLGRQITAYRRYVAFLHDASEAYLVDVPRPIKAFLPEYKRIEHSLRDVIAKSFGLCGTLHKKHPGLIFEEPFVKDADNLALAIEAKNLVNDPSKLWTIEAQFGVNITQKIRPWNPAQAKKRFLDRYEILSDEVKRHG